MMLISKCDRFYLLLTCTPLWNTVRRFSHQTWNISRVIFLSPPHNLRLSKAKAVARTNERIKKYYLPFSPQKVSCRIPHVESTMTIKMATTNTKRRDSLISQLICNTDESKAGTEVKLPYRPCLRRFPTRKIEILTFTLPQLDSTCEQACVFRWIYDEFLKKRVPNNQTRYMYTSISWQWLFVQQRRDLQENVL